MAAPERFVNTFSAGMSGDIDDVLQPPGTYRHTRNLRLLYNTARPDTGDGETERATQGKSLSLEMVPGTELATLLPAGYRLLSSQGIRTPLGLVVFSTNDTFCEIGRIRRFPWSYETLFNDSRDPNGERLNLHQGDRLQGRVITENAAMCRIYWTDNVDGHGMRTLNLYKALNVAGVSLHDTTPDYPKHLSVHQMDAQPATQWADIIFQRRIAGNLMSGAYQVAYRYRTEDGHPSPWSPLTLPVWVMDKAMSDDPTKSNHHQRYMGSAGVPTTEGLRFQFVGLDTRWSEVEVAVLYHSAGVGVERAKIVTIKAIPNTAMVVDIANYAGQAIPLHEFRQKLQTLTRVGTIAVANNLLYSGNVTQQKPLAINNEKFRAEFFSFDFDPDETKEPTFSPKPNPANASRQDGDKLTNTSRYTANLSQVKYTDGNGNKYYKYQTIFDDYINFKGQLVQQLYRGYRRGETYRVGAVCRDDRGNAYFVQPLGEVTFPTVYQESTTGYYAEGGKFLLRSLGMRLSGIRIPHEVAYYPDGKVRLSSVEIVRTEASGRLGFQGVILPSTTNIPVLKDLIEEDQHGNKVEANIGFNNAFSLLYNAEGAGVGHRSTHRSASQTGDKVKDIRAMDAANKAYWHEIHAPDVLIEGKLPDRSDATRLQLVASAHKSTVSNEIRLDLAKPGGNPDDSMMFYTKNYKVNGAELIQGDSHGRPAMGAYSRIRTWFLHNLLDMKLYEKVDPDNPKTVFGAAQNWHPFIGGDQINHTAQRPYRFPLQGVEHRVDSVLQPGTMIVKTQDWEIADIIESPSSYVSVNIVNLVQPPTLTAPADELLYQPTGYILNINRLVLDQLPTENDDAGRPLYHVINNAEVFGGDTYVNLFDFAQLYPLWEINCNRRGGYTTDYGVGRIVPIESKYNLAVREGRSLANNAFFPQAAACDNEVPHATGGIAWTQAEDWNIASVMLPKETIDLFSPQPRGTVLVDKRIYSIYSTEPKLYGEREDSFRKQLPANYVDLDGTKGEVMRLEPLFGGVYCWQRDDYGRLRTYERGIVASSVGELSTGAGRALDGVEYSKQGLGLQQFGALTAEESRAYWIDGIRRKLCRFSQAGQDELSDREKANSIMQVLLPPDAANLKHVELTTNPNDKEIWVSWSVQREGDGLAVPRGTLVYSEGLDFMMGWHDLYPDKYLLFDTVLLVSDPANKNGIHEFGPGLPGRYFGKYYDATLTLVINPDPLWPKKYDNLAFRMSEEGRKAFDNVVMTTEHDEQRVNLFPTADPDVTYRRGQLMFPLLQHSQDGETYQRMWGRSLRLKFTIKPERLKAGDRLTLLAAETIYRKIQV